jgi:hypothetical protein
VGFIFAGDAMVRKGFFPASSAAGTFWFRSGSNGANSSGIGVMKFDLILTELNGLMGWRPVHAVISPDCRGFLRVNPHKPDCFVVESARLLPNFPLPTPQSWG